MSRLAAISVVTIVLCMAAASPAQAQERSGPMVEGAVAWVGFPDDSLVSESLVGGAARWYLSNRIAVGPELVYVSGEQHYHVILTGNLTWDVRRGRVTPFVVAGGGLYQTTETRFEPSFTSREGAFTAGGGVRGQVTNRVSVGVDARIGWETHIRIGGVIGVRLGR